MREQQILIASSSFDTPTWGPIAAELESKGRQVLVYESDKVALGIARFDISVTSAEGLQVAYNGQIINPEAIGAAWYRRTGFIANTVADATQQLAIDGERRAIQAGIWHEISDAAWLNSPDRITLASQKVTQLALASELGFSIPETVITNNWDSISDNLPADIIFKSSHPLLHGAKGVLSLFTTPFKNNRNSLPLASNPYPGFWQPRLQKAREWRITAVDEEIFAAAIYTADDAKDDWRRHQEAAGKVLFRSERFPDELAERCLQYLGKIGLRYGAFDFIEDAEGKVTFLECNPNGQFRWIEDDLGLPISAAISSSLMKIAAGR
jgi:glutathione synthase/RimK-type ligase-like ATP-grasp enzyme